MKKIMVPILFCLTLFFVCSVASFAEDNAQGAGTSQMNSVIKIVEVPDVKILMDGKLTAYKDVPVNSSQRTLLPLRELLVNLGVTNDDQHIIWDGNEKSVTVFKDSTKLYLKAGSKTAYVNDSPVELDIAPLIYEKNQRFYIPLRFVSGVLGKKVVWDGSSSAILIRDMAEFNEMKDLLEKIQAASDSVNKCKFNMDMTAESAMGAMTFTIIANASSEVDRLKKTLHTHTLLDMAIFKMDIEQYYADNTVYGKNLDTGAWEKQVLSSEEYEKLFTSEGTVSAISATDPLGAGLVLSQNEESGDIVLKGDMFLNMLYNEALSGSAGNVDTDASNVDFDKYDMVVNVDKDTYLVKSIVLNCEGTNTYDDGTKSTISMTITLNYTEYDGGFEVTVPEEIINTAVDKTESSIGTE